MFRNFLIYYSARNPAKSPRVEPKLPASKVKAKLPFMVFSQDKGLVSEHDSATDAVQAYLGFIKDFGAVAGEKTAIYKRVPTGWKKF